MEANESLWEWSSCTEEENIDFQELWWAVLGGGGGTFGIVTSLYLQLHDYLPMQQFNFQLTTLNQTCGIPIGFPATETGPYDIFDDQVGDNYFQVLGAAYWEFYLDFFVNPSALGVTEEESESCSSHAHNIFGSSGVCYGDGAVDAFVGAWKRHITNKNQSMVENGIALLDVQLVHDCIDAEGVIVRDLLDQAEANGLATIIFADYPYSLIGAGLENQDLYSFNVLMPKSWVLGNRDKTIAMLRSPNTHTYFALGGVPSRAQDKGSVSLSTAHRDAAFMMLFVNDFPTGFYGDLFPEMFDTSNGESFPGFLGSNHINAYTRGPLKNDWTQPCPLNWSDEERDEMCISLQECVYGTERLNRLEAFKTTIDADYMFDCYGCIGNNRMSDPTASSIPAPISSLSPGETSAPPSEEAAESLAPITVPTDDTSPPTTSPVDDSGSGRVSPWMLVVVAGMILSSFLVLSIP